MLQPVGSIERSTARRASLCVNPLPPRPPEWVDRLVGTDVRRLERSPAITVSGVGPLVLYRAAIDNAAALSIDDLRCRVADVYLRLADGLGEAGRHAIRFWNFVPGPGAIMAPGLDRYMVFNSGRYDAFARWYGSRGMFSGLPTASGVGVEGDDLVICCLASDTPGVPVENPRQKSSWQYSVRYGPQPPCFARATIASIAGRRRVLIGGTASIVGEDSNWLGDVEQQVEETFANLEALIGAASGVRDTGGHIHLLSDIRVYVPRQEHVALIYSLVAAKCRPGTHVELRQSQLCRPELLVEIEGTSALDA